MTEREKKMLVSKDEYDYLIEQLGYELPGIKKPVIRQINYYFDTEDLAMNQNHITCRIRLKNGHYKGIIKRHFPDTDQSTETEIKIYDGIEENTFTDMGLQLQGSLITERCILFKDSNYEVVLDKNEYLGYIDYEIEIEYSPDYEEKAELTLKVLHDMLVKQNNSASFKKIYISLPNCSSKSSRFFERKILLKNKST